ncbi:MAG: glycosyltransferase family 2 protein [Bacteroidetes bacterium]|nr:glycosyltransferase family 2 protein [Bacteroidota bacterium]MDA1120267.1 glycosyltransferase family 2 protein [Bacteroidota bacterium]
MKLSLVITVFNEEESIKPLIEKICASLVNLNYEVIFVDDGSSDNTVKRINECSVKGIKLVRLNRNYGQTAAMTAGIDHASGDYIITLDGDLQNDPADIPEMLEKMKSEDCDVVAGWRKDRRDNILRTFPSAIANWFIRLFTGLKFRDYGCTLKIFKTDVARSLGLHGELHRYISILAHMQGAHIVQIPVTHHSRKFGKSKYGLGRTLKVVSDLMLMVFFQKFLRKPMHLFGTIGILSFIVGLIINVYLLWLKILGEDIWGRPILILGITLLLAGIQFITIGFIAELVSRAYFESQNRKTYRVKEVVIF